MHIMKQNKSIMCGNQIDQSINHKIPYVEPPPKPILFLHESISITPLFGITKLNSCLYKNVKNKENIKNQGGFIKTVY